MLHTDGMTVRSPLGALVGVAFVFCGCLAQPALADLFVSDHELAANPNQYQVLRFNDPPTGTAKPLTFPIGPIASRGEGLAYGVINGVPTLFVADTAGKITEYNPATGQFLGGQFVGNFQSGLPSTGAISLNADGSTLYVAVQASVTPGVGQILAFSTLNPNGSPIYSVSTDAAHDVRVGPNGKVYATDPFPPVNTLGVLQFSADLSSFVTFVPSSVISNATGMTFDNLGDLWVSNFGAAFGGFDSVYEFSPSGGFILQVQDPLFNGPVGLATGPDGNIYVANIRGGNILEINLSSCTTINCSVSEFIANAGFQPKYPEFVERVPEPNTLSLLLVGMLGLPAWLGLRVRRRESRIGITTGD